MNIARLLETARTNDLYDLLAGALNELANRNGDESLPLDARILARYADIRFDEQDGEFIVVYYAEGCAELASEEFGAVTR